MLGEKTSSPISMSDSGRASRADGNDVVERHRGEHLGQRLGGERLRALRQHALRLGVDEGDAVFSADGDERIGRVLQELEHPGLGLLGALEEAVRTHERVDPRAQLGIGVRLDEVVVRARLQPFDDLLRLRLHRQQQDGELPLGAVRRTKEPADLDPRDPRHHPVEHQHVRRRLARELLEDGRAVSEDLHVVLAGENERALARRRAGCRRRSRRLSVWPRASWHGLTLSWIEWADRNVVRKRDYETTFGLPGP